MQKSVRERRCAVCGGAAEEGALCECCRESFALCDMENYIMRRAAGNCASAPSNAFKNADFMVKYPKKTTGCCAHESFCGERPAPAGESG